MYWKVGELAKMAGVSVRTLHYYEQIGLLTPSNRTDGSYRLYDEENLHRLMQILCLSQVGMPLKKIGEVLSDYPQGVLGHLKKHLQIISERAENIQRLQNRLCGVVRKIADNQQPTWLDWAVSPELAHLHEKWCESDAFDTLALYESYLLQSPQWKTLIDTYMLEKSRDSDDERLQISAWEIVTNFELLTDFNKACYEYIWCSPLAATFANVDINDAKQVRSLWQRKHLSLWRSTLSGEATKTISQTHHLAMETWPAILTDMEMFARQSAPRKNVYLRFDNWLSGFSLGNREIAKQLVIGFLAEPLLKQGLCLNEERYSVWHKWLCHIASKNS